MMFKQIFQLESIVCMYLDDILKRLVANVCFDASFVCLFRFVACRVTFMLNAVERNVKVCCYAYN